MIRQFMRPAEIAKELGLQPRTIRAYTIEMRGYPERYRHDFFGFGKSLAVRFVAVKDYSENREALRNHKEAKPYHPRTVERELGILPVLTTLNVDKEALARYIATPDAQKGVTLYE